MNLLLHIEERTRGMRRLVAWTLVCVAAVLPAAAAEVTMSGDVLPPADLGSVRTNGVGDGSAANPFVYPFATANGLDMGAHKIYGNNEANKSIRLDLNGGSIIAATNASGQCTNVAFDLKNDAGTYRAGDLNIQNVVDIRIGKVWTYQEVKNGAWSRDCGNVIIGTNTSSGRAGKVEIAEIWTWGGDYYSAVGTGDITVDSTGDVLIWDGVNSGDIFTYNRWCGSYQSPTPHGGTVVVRHDGAFRARDVYTDSVNSYGGWISLDGDILADGASGSMIANLLNTRSLQGEGGLGGAVAVRGYSSVTVSSGIYTYHNNTYPYGSPAGSVTITNILGNISIGTLQTWSTAQNSDAYHPGPGGGSVLIVTTGGSLSITGAVDASASTASGCVLSGGNVTLTSRDNLTLGGTINLTATAGRKGNLSLTSSGGTITLPSLDLKSVGWARLDFGARCSVTGAVSNFVTNYTGGTGMPLDPYVTGQTELRTPAGKKIIYYPGVSGNEYLDGKSYRVATLGGTAGQGGILTPYQPPGLVVFFK